MSAMGPRRWKAASRATAASATQARSPAAGRRAPSAMPAAAQGGAVGRVEAAVSIPMPARRFSRERLPEIVAALAVTARHIERDLR
ncbi:IclR family transcriptional regulator C-terminal domain-containing protein [Actinoplanes sp. NPDC023714]|uniref:IclR family transcriptional regulator domain-containing protein n=1 Tax=Actinoplanes sp. NPDC023714 TaxID=3154322 RepID=UPI0033E5C843